MGKIDAKLLARQIDAYCATYSISKSEFYKRTGISTATLSQWRNGLYEPSEKSINAIEVFVGFPIEVLLYGHPSSHPTFEPDPFDDFTAAAHKYSGKLSEKDKGIIISMMERLARDLEESKQNGDTE